MVFLEKKDRYLYRCTCEQLRKRPLVIKIQIIIKELDEKWFTKDEIIKKGKNKYIDWPKDRDTVFRALKTMSKHKLLDKRKRGLGQATLWSLNKKLISNRELMLHEIKQLEKVINHLPKWVFESEYYKVEIDKPWENIREALVYLENLDIASDWTLFSIKENEILTSKKFKKLDKQLSIIFIFCMFSPGWALLNKWFNRSQIPFKIKADFELINIFIKHFYPEKTKEEIFNLLDKYELDATLSNRLDFLMMLLYHIMQLDYDYRFKMFDKDKFSLLDDKELGRSRDVICREESKLSKERINSINPMMYIMQKPKYKFEEIDLFMEKYKEILDPSN